MITNHKHRGPFVVVIASAPGTAEPLVVCTCCGALSYWNGGTSGIWWGGQDDAGLGYVDGAAWTPVTDIIDDQDEAFDWAFLEALTSPQIAA